ncbi:MAG: hypothetical protein AAFU70_01300, partial [Planctomycetota bacterium]
MASGIAALDWKSPNWAWRAGPRIGSISPPSSGNAAAMAARVPLVSGAVGRYGGYLSVYKPWEGAEAPCFGCLTPE